MTEFESTTTHIPPDRLRVWSFHPATWVLVPLAAILFQVYVPRFLSYLSYLELPLLVTVYFSVMRRQPPAGALTGCLIGLAQDSLTHHYLGMYGIVKTLIGYSAASISLRFDVDNTGLRFLLGFGFFLAHQVLYWALSHSLLGTHEALHVPQTVIAAFLNAVVALPLFQVLDRLKSEAR
ncbi:MAG: rod shape-determining protein MreD [Bryobacteraceae bacterium]|jgi:rod shape-determining protein MreD